MYICFKGTYKPRYTYILDKYGNIYQYILGLHPLFCRIWYIRPVYKEISGLMSLLKFWLALLFLEYMVK